MKLIRKQSAPVITDRYGIQHPNLCIKHFAVPEDKKIGWLEIYCGYYHNLDAEQSMYEPANGFQAFCARFDKIESQDWPSYPDVLNDIEITSNGDVVALNPDVKTWFLNQTRILDCEGKPFAENWEFA